MASLPVGPAAARKGVRVRLRTRSSCRRGRLRPVRIVPTAPVPQGANRAGDRRAACAGGFRCSWWTRCTSCAIAWARLLRSSAADINVHGVASLEECSCGTRGSRHHPDQCDAQAGVPGHGGRASGAVVAQRAGAGDLRRGRNLAARRIHSQRHGGGVPGLAGGDGPDRNDPGDPRPFHRGDWPARRTSRVVARRFRPDPQGNRGRQGQGSALDPVTLRSVGAKHECPTMAPSTHSVHRRRKPRR